MLILRNFIPVFQLIPNKRERETLIARATMDRIGRELIEEKKRALMATGEKGAGRDLLSLLIQANMDKDLGDNMRMSDEEVLGRAWRSHSSLLVVIADAPHLHRSTHFLGSR